eukprot:298336-Rhodomonas_salina.1
MSKKMAAGASSSSSSDEEDDAGEKGGCGEKAYDSDHERRQFYLMRNEKKEEATNRTTQRIEVQDGEHGWTYEGTVDEDINLDGPGKITFHDKEKTTLEGEFTKGKWPTKGKLSDNTGLRYEGGLKGRLMHGVGSLTLPGYDENRRMEMKSSYNGGFKDNLYDGQGNFMWPDSSSYLGGFSLGKKSGEGFFQSREGDTYQGQWEDDMMHGKGTYETSSNGVTFEGQFVRGSPVKGTLRKRSAEKQAPTGEYVVFADNAAPGDHPL